MALETVKDSCTREAERLPVQALFKIEVDSYFWIVFYFKLQYIHWEIYAELILIQITNTSRDLSFIFNEHFYQSSY